MKCTNCGQENPPSSSFCSSCGTPLAQSQPPPPPRGANRASSLKEKARAGRSRTVKARKVLRQLRRVSRWGLATVFLGVSVFTLWNNASNLPILRDMNIPSIDEVFGGEDSEAVDDTSTTSASTPAEDDDAVGPAQSGPLIPSSVTATLSTPGGQPSLAVDGDPSTGWIPCLDCEDPFGQGQAITLSFEDTVVIESILVHNGVLDAPGAMPVFSVLLEAGGQAIEATLGDSLQLYRITPPAEMRDESLTITIQGVVRVDEETGTVGIGEIELIGIPDPQARQ